MLTGHVLASLIQTLLSLGVVLGVAVALGFRPTADPLDWLAAIGVLTLFTLALIWLATALGPGRQERRDRQQHPDVPHAAALPRQRLRPRRHHARPGSRQFAEYQPFTPVTETLRGLLTGTPIGTHAIAAIAWSVGIAVASYLWASHLYTHRRSG